MSTVLVLNRDAQAICYIAMEIHHFHRYTIELNGSSIPELCEFPGEKDSKSTSHRTIRFFGALEAQHWSLNIIVVLFVGE